MNRLSYIAIALIFCPAASAEDLQSPQNEIEIAVDQDADLQQDENEQLLIPAAEEEAEAYAEAAADAAEEAAQQAEIAAETAATEAKEASDAAAAATAAAEVAAKTTPGTDTEPAALPGDRGPAQQNQIASNSVVKVIIEDTGEDSKTVRIQATGREITESMTPDASTRIIRIESSGSNTATLITITKD